MFTVPTTLDSQLGPMVSTIVRVPLYTYIYLGLTSQSMYTVHVMCIMGSGNAWVSMELLNSTSQHNKPVLEFIGMKSIRCTNIRARGYCYSYIATGEMTELRVETGRRCGLMTDCRMCDEGEVENVEHFLLHCTGMAEEERREMERLMKRLSLWRGGKSWRTRTRWYGLEILIWICCKPQI